jgi:hypothetical protein
VSSGQGRNEHRRHGHASTIGADLASIRRNAAIIRRKAQEAEALIFGATSAAEVAVYRSRSKRLEQQAEAFERLARQIEERFCRC